MHTATAVVVVVFVVTNFIVLSFRVSFTASCVMDLRSFPHDTQTCHLKFGSCKYRTIASKILFNAREGGREILFYKVLCGGLHPHFHLVLNK